MSFDPSNIVSGQSLFARLRLRPILENAPSIVRRRNASTAEVGNPSTCFMRAQTYLAQTSFGQDLERSGQDHPRAKRSLLKQESMKMASW
jgi:hypothetical protein